MENIVQIIINEFPDMLQKCVEIYMYSGWYELVKKTLQEIKDIIYPYSINITQIKQKFGGLRIYYDECPKEKKEQIDNIIKKAERESFDICEITGKPGKTRSLNGWRVTLCDEEYKYWIKNRKLK